VIYTVLAFTALAALGGAVLSTCILPRWMGWLTLVYSLVGLGVFVYTHDIPPLLHYLPLLIIGILLLRSQPKLSIREGYLEKREQHEN
jgi:hypothetical protein